jgi:4-hydroxy-3-methylbut-2-enyl diphosphate reductase
LNITVSRNIGFCFGVRRAVDIALKTAGENGSAVTYGDIIHNPQVVEELKEKGISAVEDLNGLNTGDKLIIRSHGVSPEIYEQCREKGIDVIDATCPYVKRISKKARYCDENKIQLIIFGEAAHPEVIGINGWFSNNAIIINSVKEAEMIEGFDKAVIVAQTTADRKLWKEVLKVVENKVAELEVFDSLCEATMERQKEAEEISQECDYVIVIGGKKSSNTKKLYEVCKKNCTKTFHIEQVSELDDIDFSFAENIGIISGASTPDWIIKEGIKHMSDLNKPTEENDIIKAEENNTAKEKVDNKVEEKTNIDLVETESPEEAVEAAEEAKEPVEEAAQSEQESPEAPEAEAVEEKDEAKSTQESFMEDVEKSFVQVKNGMVVTGKVVTVNDEEICVNIGYKADGIITKTEFSSDPDVKMTDEVKEGDEIEVEVIRVRDEDGNVLLSRKNIESRKQWQALLDTFEEQEFFDCIGKQVVKGGLIATINGIRAFIPASHLDVRYVNDITEYVGKQMKVKIIEVEKHRRRVVASRKEYILEQEKLEKEELWNAIEEGSTVRGIVRRLTDFGAFVDIGGIDGLVHVTDLAWGRVNHPRDIVSINQEIDVVVLKVDKDRERISLGYKQTQHKPWDVAEEKYPVGSIVHGKVVRIVPFGAFIELEPGLDGLIHISQVAQKRIEKVEDVLQLNQEVDVKVLDLNVDNKRISLSIRALSEPDTSDMDDYDNEGEAHSVLVDTSDYE